MFDPQLFAAEWYLGGLDGEDLSRFAREALEQGYDGKNLAQLAVLTKPTKRDVEGIVDSALRELGVAAPLSTDSAASWVLGSVKAGAASLDVTAINLVGKLLTALRELEEPYLKEVKSYYGVTGNYWVVGVVWKPAIKDQISSGKVTDFLRRTSSFIEQVCTSEDAEAINVLWIEMFEDFVHSLDGVLKFMWPILGPSTKAVIRDVAFHRRETDHLPNE